MQIFTTQALLEKYKDYSNPADKIKRETEKQNLISLKKGLYVDDKNLVSISDNLTSHIGYFDHP